MGWDSDDSDGDIMVLEFVVVIEFAIFSKQESSWDSDDGIREIVTIALVILRCLCKESLSNETVREIQIMEFVKLWR